MKHKVDFRTPTGGVHKPKKLKCIFRKRALVHHPDRHAGAPDTERREQERRFKEVGEAYGILSDPKKRARYDHGQDLDDDGSGMAG